MLNDRLESGVSVAEVPAAEYDTIDGTLTAPAVGRKLMVVPVIVAASIGSLNVTTTALFTDTPIAPPSGDTDTIVGAVTSGASAVVKTEVKAGVSALPATSVTAFVTEIV